MARKSNTEQRREEIVAALLAVVAENGYEKATIQAIAQQAGLAPGLIHYHFKNKEEILLHLVKSLAELSRARYLECAGTAATPQQKLKAYIDARLAKGKGANPDAVAAWVIIGAEAVRQPSRRKEPARPSARPRAGLRRRRAVPRTLRPNRAPAAARPSRHG